MVDVVKELESFGLKVDVSDPWADESSVRETLGIGYGPCWTENMKALSSPFHMLNLSKKRKLR